MGCGNAGNGSQRRCRFPTGAARLADQLYAALARGRDLRRLVSIIGEAALSERDRSYLAFAHDFEQSFVNQGGDRRSVEETLELAWKLLLGLPAADLKRIDPELLARYEKGPARWGTSANE
jgi:V/A-type H+-transporting ATPase subunit B